MEATAFAGIIKYNLLFEDLWSNRGTGGWHKLLCDWIRMAEQGVDEDDFGEWTPAFGGRGSRRNIPLARQNSKRSWENIGSDEGDRIVRRKVGREDIKIILKFKTEDELVSFSLIALSRELKKKVGEVKMAKVL